MAEARSVTKLSTILSTKGQVILPKDIREQRRWTAGTRLTVENTADGVLLTASPVFAPTRPDAAFGILRYEGRPKTIREMNDSVAAEAKRRHARGRY
jgi:AbrB family looped-hinge helix DNA binding protein